MSQAEFTCSDCGKDFPSQKALSGHMGGSTKLIGSYTSVHPDAHGTRKGYEKEVRLKLKTCVLCRRANAKYTREHRARGLLKARKGIAK